MEARPKIKIKLSKTDKILEIISLLLLVQLWIGTIAIFSKLPDVIPIHFNAAGEADDFGKKIHIFILPIVATVLYIGMSILNKFPHIYNYPATITVQNAKRLYTSATRLIRVLKLTVVLIFSGITYMTIKSTFDNNSELGSWFLPSIIALITIPTIFYLFKTNFK